MDVSAFNRLLENVADEMLDPIATEGLKALKQILDGSGFADSPALKDYDLTSSIGNGVVEFVITLNDEGLESETRRKMRDETKNSYRGKSKQVTGLGDADRFVRTYMMRPNGRPERIAGMRDARKTRHEGRKFKQDARTIASDRASKITPKTSGERHVAHQHAAVAPRGMSVEDGKLRIAMQREIRNSSKTIMPQGSYQGIMRDFVEKLQKIIVDQFSPVLETIVTEALS